MNILAIETSCDETGVAIIESKGALKHRIITSFLASQIKIHAPYGGVVPRLAAREHVKNLPILVKKALKKYRGQIDIIAYTDHPGLEPSLLVGRTFAKTLGYALGVPVYPVNHLEGHIFANFVSKSQKSKRVTPFLRNDKSQKLFPAIALVISGGHTQLYEIRSFQKIELLGETIDDALGEALDKGARILGLPYPGGPEIEKLAKRGRKDAFIFPSPMLKSGNLNFSFAGLKTALLYKVEKLQKIEKLNQLPEQMRADLALAYETAAFKVILEKTKQALLNGARSLLVGGGVAANQTLREALASLLSHEFPAVCMYIPEKQFCTDNAVMIALAYAVPTLSRKHRQIQLKHGHNSKLAYS